MRRFIPLSALMMVSCQLFVGTNPDYCDAELPCPSGKVCNLTRHSCGDDGNTLALTAVAPSSATTAGMVSVTLTGQGFKTPASVQFGGVQATNVTVMSPTEIRATVPANSGACGAVPVLVQNGDGKQISSSALFKYVYKDVRFSALSPPALHSSNMSPAAVAAGDLTNDGVADLLITDTGSPNVFLYTGTKDLAFTYSDQYSLQTPAYKSLIIADLNGDTLPDLAIGRNDQFWTFRKQASGFMFAPNPMAVQPGIFGAIIVSEFTGDQYRDIIVLNNQSHSVDIWAGTAGTNITRNLGPSWGTATGLALAAADFTGDGKNDLVVATGEKELLIYRGDGTTVSSLSMVSMVNSVTQIQILALDINLDGKQDIAYYSNGLASGGFLSVRYGNGNGAFGEAITVDTPGTPGYMAAEDVDCDDLPDFVLSNNSTNHLTFYRNPKGGAFADGVVLQTSGAAGTPIFLPRQGDKLKGLIAPIAGAPPSVGIYRNSGS